MDLLSFRLPEQRPLDEASVDFSPVAIQRWVEELPMGHIGGASKQIYEMLHKVNRLDISVDNRYEILKAIIPTLHTVLAELERKYTGLPFPLPKKSLRFAQVSIKLFQEVVIACQAVLDGEEHASWLYRKMHKQLWLEMVRDLIYYLHRILRTYQLLHRAQPPGIWQAIHALYWSAKEQGRESNKVKLPLEDSYTTIEAEYLRAILLTMLEPQLFSREQMLEVQGNMSVWVKQCDLLEIHSGDPEAPGYCIRRDADGPFTLYAERCCSNCDEKEEAVLLFDISGLAVHIGSLLEGLDEGGMVTPKGGVPISRETLNIVGDGWRLQDSTREERKNNKQVEKVDVAISMSGIFRLMQADIDKSAHGISDQHMNDDIEELSFQSELEELSNSNQGTTIGARVDQDIWTSVFYATEFMQKSWSRDSEEREYHFIPAIQRNRTKNGYCLIFDRENIEPFQVGELMGVKAEGERSLQLCMVRWLTDSSKRVTTGLMSLVESVEPVLVVLHHDDVRTALYCLLGIGMDSRPQIFLPHLPGIREKKLFLVVDGKEVPISLNDRVVVSPLFDAFHFRAVSVDSDQEMSLQQFNRELHRLINPDLDESENAESEDFVDLWDSL